MVVSRLTTLGVAVIGAGHWGPNLIRAFHDDERSDVEWVVDRDASRLTQVASRLPRARLGTEAAEALADPAVDVAVVATPTRTHYLLAREAIEAGKHVLVEKPITADSAEGEELCALAEQAGVVLMVGHVFLFNGAVQQVKRYLEARDLGRIYYLDMTRTNLGPIRTDVNAAWDLAAHDISIANWWLESAPLTVSASGGTWINAGNEDAVFATLRYPGDVLVNLRASWLNPRKARDITVVGDRRMLTFDDLNLAEPIRVYDRGVADEPTPIPYIDDYASFRASVRHGDVTIPHVPLREPLGAECDEFLSCIAEGRAPASGGRVGVAVVRVLEALERSLHGGGTEQSVAPATATGVSRR